MLIVSIASLVSVEFRSACLRIFMMAALKSLSDNPQICSFSILASVDCLCLTQGEIFLILVWWMIFKDCTLDVLGIVFQILHLICIFCLASWHCARREREHCLLAQGQGQSASSPLRLYWPEVGEEESCASFFSGVFVWNGLVLSQKLPSFFFFNIYIFGCARSSLWHGGSSMQHVGSLAVPHGIWFPDQGLNLGTPALGARSLSHGPLGKFQGFCLVRLLFPTPSTMKVRLSSRLFLSVPTGKGMTEDEMAGSHHRLDGHVFG